MKRLDFKQKILIIGLACLLPLIMMMSSTLYAADEVEGANIQLIDGIMTLPQIRVGDQYFKATFKLLDSNNSLIFQLTDVSSADYVDKTHYTTFDVSNMTLEISRIEINEASYSMVLKADNDLKNFTVLQMSQNDLVSFLFMIAAKSISFKESGTYSGKNIGEHFVVDAGSNITIFSDRPHRIAKPFIGGLNGFASFYSKSDFLGDPPNVTFSAENIVTGQEEFTIFEMEVPFVEDGKFIIPVTTIIGSLNLPSFAEYRNGSFIIDSLWSSISSVATSTVNVVTKPVETAVEKGVDAVEDAGKAAADVVKDVAHLGLRTVEEIGEDLKKGIELAEDLVEQLILAAVEAVINEIIGEYKKFIGAIANANFDFQAMINATKAVDPATIASEFSKALSSVNSSELRSLLENMTISIAYSGKETEDFVDMSNIAAGIMFSPLVVNDLISLDTSNIAAFTSTGRSYGANDSVATAQVSICLSPGSPSSQDSGVAFEAIMGAGVDGQQVTVSVSINSDLSFGDICIAIGEATTPAPVDFEIGYSYTLISTIDEVKNFLSN
ncbi:MAG: hypothetical protein HQK67_04725 [Desulfamplus sp.]|nr:hypothetical protein [Desulfamplus sp.]